MVFTNLIMLIDISYSLLIHRVSKSLNYLWAQVPNLLSLHSTPMPGFGFSEPLIEIASNAVHILRRAPTQVSSVARTIFELFLLYFIVTPLPYLS
jgi:hypothetical protein